MLKCGQYTRLSRVVFLVGLLVILPGLFWTQQSVAPPDYYHPPTEAGHLPIFKNQAVRNVILLIGDGMSTATMSAARIKAAGATGKLNMDRMPIAGFVRTSSAQELITDSAAASTAMATGFKTNNGMISTSPDGKRLLTIMEACRRKGMATGLVATSNITDATPAGFAAHVRSRKQELEIADQLLQNGVDVLLGGGKEFFLPVSQAGGKREDGRDLMAQARQAGYASVASAEELRSAQGPKLLGLFQNEALTTMPPEPTLAEMANQAVKILSRHKKGFILMVEGSQIDWGNHENDGQRSIRQTLLFDESVKVALDFAARDKHTLVVVVADHETGGLGINGGRWDGASLDLAWTTKGHTGATVPLYAFGPGALELSGFRENTDIARTFARLLGIRSFPVSLP